MDEPQTFFKLWLAVASDLWPVYHSIFLGQKTNSQNLESADTKSIRVE